MRSLLLAVLLVSSAALTGCGAPMASPHMPAGAATSSEVKAPGDAKLGDHTKCPVSGDDFVVSEDSPKAEYQGKTYYFCCPGCAKDFQADPQKYLTKPAS